MGDDANPCSRNAPRKTYAGAISKTAAGGEISTLDPGGFGAVTITKAMTIEGDGDLASTTFSGTNAVNVGPVPTTSWCCGIFRSMEPGADSTGFA